MNEIILPPEVPVEKNSLQALHEGFIHEMQQHLTLIVKDEEGAKQALSCCLQARKIKNAIEASRKEIVRPYIDYQKSIMKMSRDVYEAIEKIENSFREKTLGWIERQKENPFTRVDEISVDDGKISLKTEWDYEITDEQSIPREFLTLDVCAIDKAIKNGLRCIDGLKIFEKQTVQIRVKK